MKKILSLLFMLMFVVQACPLYSQLTYDVTTHRRIFERGDILKVLEFKDYRPQFFYHDIMVIELHREGNDKDVIYYNVETDRYTRSKDAIALKKYSGFSACGVAGKNKRGSLVIEADENNFSVALESVWVSSGKVERKNLYHKSSLFTKNLLTKEGNPLVLYGSADNKRIFRRGRYGYDDDATFEVINAKMYVIAYGYKEK